jgi:uncharacterized protein (DUF2252 family)
MSTTSSRRRPARSADPRPEPAARTRSQSAAFGVGLRTTARRSAHGEWNVSAARRDPIRILETSSRGRVPELVPIRYGRMLRSPFAFLRGSAAVMAHDLAKTPSTGLQAQLCGDCHLLNFGLFATPERHLVFDINDFDETHPGPWEWDLKRLVASFAVAARDGQMTDAQARDAVSACVSAYGERMQEYASMSPLDVWYAQLDWEAIVEAAPEAETRRFGHQLAAQARRHITEHLFPKIAATDGQGSRFVDQPPLLFHLAQKDTDERIRDAIAQYRSSLPEDRRLLLDRYHVEDQAFKVVGIGSVGTRCAVVLMMSTDNEPLILQFKEADRSVLEPWTERSAYANQGQRVVMGQRLMQSSGDIFLGWARGKQGNEFFVRQLRDMKMSIPVERLSPRSLRRYARLCGWALSRAHAKSSDPVAIGAYMGKGDQFARAMERFALAYADQTERDHAALVKAVRTGRLTAVTEE